MGIKNREFVPYYQPIVNQYNDIVGAEVLARWDYPGGNLLEATSFISSIEKNGLEDKLSDVIINQVCAELRSSEKISQIPIFISFNINISLVMNPEFRNFLRVLNIKLIQSGVTPVFEITERENVHKFPGAADIFEDLVNHGIQFAVDDYGAGYAGSDLADVIQPAFIKIDRQFTADIDNPVANGFICSVVRLAKIMNATVIAEGVETGKQFRHLKKLGVSYFQGYFFSVPMPFAGFHQQLFRQRKVPELHV